MLLQNNPIGPVPEETARVARTAFPKGNLYLRIRDELGTIYEDSLFADLFSHTGQPDEAAWRLALVCVLQYLEDLSDQHTLSNHPCSICTGPLILRRPCYSAWLLYIQP